MIYGVHAYLFTEHWSDESLPILDLARDLGADCVEIPLGDDIYFTPELTRRRAEALGIELFVGPGGLWPIECDLSADAPADRARGLAWHKVIVDRTAEMGATAYTGALYGHPGTVQRRLPPPDEYPRTAEGLARLADYASGQGIKIVLEPMSHFRTHIANTPEQIMHLIGLAGHPNLRVLLDTYHLVTEVRDYGAAIRTVSDRLWGIHACENDRGLPGGGLVPWDAVFRTLREIGFDGRMLLETYASSLGDFAYRRGMFHDVCPDGVVFAREGLRFIKSGMAG
jgi:D-psicose/D-tagatose/L-ribulose 3-epimerase